MFAEYLDTHDLAAALQLPFRCPYPAAGNWASLPEAERRCLLDNAAAWREKPWPMLTASQYLGFAERGDRAVFETPYFARRKKLIAAVTGYCAAPNEADLRAAADGLWCICEETSWVISAHNCDAHPGAPTPREKPLPDTEDIGLDLFAAQTAMILSLTLALMGTALDRLTPMLSERAGRELEKRVLTPFQRRDDFWWMGITRQDLCNWTPWIVSNVLLTAALRVPERRRLARLAERGLRMTDRWLKCVPEDGGCDEGVGYWNMAGGALMDILQLMTLLTGGAMDFRADEKLRGILSFPAKMWLGGGWFANFADCDAKPEVCGERLCAAGAYLGDEALRTLGASLLRSQEAELRDTPQFWRLLNRLFPGDIPKGGAARPMEDVWLPELQVRLLRRGRLTLIAKGGHNGESHNHNDVGSFIICADGEPEIVDAGNLEYTGKTFSAERYTIWNTRSRNHNVPLIGDWEQRAGTEFAAASVEFLPDGLQLDMAGAYPPEAGLTGCLRTLRVTEDAVTVEDQVELWADTPVTFTWMLRREPLPCGEREMRCGPVKLAWDRPADCAVERIAVAAGSRMAKAFPDGVWRLALTSPAAKHHRMTVRVTVAGPRNEVD